MTYSVLTALLRTLVRHPIRWMTQGAEHERGHMEVMDHMLKQMAAT